jgi:hypothetical protein
MHYNGKEIKKENKQNKKDDDKMVFGIAYTSKVDKKDDINTGKAKNTKEMNR